MEGLLHLFLEFIGQFLLERIEIINTADTFLHKKN